VVFQFSISVALILGAIVIGSQLDFMKKQDLGFKKDQQLILPLSSKEIAKNYTALKGELLKTPGISTVTCGSTYPGIRNIDDMLFYGEGRAATDNLDISTASIEDDYVETLGLKLLYGRTFYRNSSADSNNLILNETAVKRLGYDPAKAVGRKINYDFHGAHNTMQIVGVVKDFNFESLHNPIRPFAFSVNGLFASKYNYTIVRIATGDYSRTLAAVEKVWNKVNPIAPFVYSFLDQDFQRNYEKEERTSHIVIYSTSIAILIACLGLFGLAAFSAEQRTKEIGIRKVLGASIVNVTLLLSGDFIRLALLAILIASPIAWYGMHQWLQNFNYRIGISWWMFAAAGGLAVVIALITVSFQSIKTALANPVKSLRAE
jgi:putative ABC transport system permease protein